MTAFALRLNTPADLIEAAPYLVGYPPSNQLVTIGLAEGKVGLTCALDLTPVDEDDRRMCASAATHLVHGFRRDGATQIIAILYSDVPRGALIEELLEAANRAGIQVVDLLDVHDGTWGAVLDPSGQRQPMPLTELSLDLLHKSGRTMQMRREDAVEVLTPRTLTGAELDELNEAIIDGQLGALTNPAALRSAAMAWLSGEGPLTPAMAGEVAAALRHTALSDLALGLLLDERRDTAMERLAYIATVVLDKYRAQPLAMWGIGRYLAGQGHATQQALDLALAVDPDHGLSRVVRQSLSISMPPQEMSAFLAEAVALQSEALA